MKLHRYHVRMRPSRFARENLEPEMVEGLRSNWDSIEYPEASFRTRREAQRCARDCNIGGLWAEYYVHDSRTDTALT